MLGGISRELPTPTATGFGGRRRRMPFPPSEPGVWPKASPPVFPRRALQSVVSTSGLARRAKGLVHREQPKISEESVRPWFVIARVVPLTRPMQPPAHHRPQSAANKAVDGRERVVMRMPEVAQPSFQDGVERCHYACERIPAGPLGFITDLVP